MIKLIHGENTEVSRNELNRIRAEMGGKDIRTVEGRTADVNILTQALESPSIFALDPVVIIENLLSSLGRKIKAAEQYCDILKSAAEHGTDIILWEDRVIAKTLTDKLGKNVRISL